MKKVVDNKVSLIPDDKNPTIKYSKKEKGLTYHFAFIVLRTVWGIRDNFTAAEIKQLEKKHKKPFNDLLMKTIRLGYAKNQKDMADSEDIEALEERNKKLENVISELRDQLNKPLPDNIPNKKYDKKDFDFVIELKEKDGIPFSKGVDKLIEKCPDRQINRESFLRRLSEYYNSHKNKNKNQK
jgi:hypothetical protein